MSASDVPPGRLGIVLLCHKALDRAAQVARYWADAGCPVVVHVDRKTPRADVAGMQNALSDHPGIRFAPRHRCEWGTWGIVAASLDASALLLETAPSVQHVFLASGACLPLRPVPELVDYLDAHPNVDFIESATTADVPWTVGGLDEERFTLFFPFSWRKNRRLFDRSVRLQRRLGIRRPLPPGLVPHLGSQWWCLTRQTLQAILEHPERRRHDAYFKRVWIPDESYFQTLARCVSRNIESRSLTLSRFDFQGKPHIFYDDHLHLLRRSDCFVARKIWHGADRLYETFLAPPGQATPRPVPKPPRIDRLFARAAARRTRGRSGLYMQSRFPRAESNTARSAGPYVMFQGFAELFDGFAPWLAEQTEIQVHGRLFSPGRAEFATRSGVTTGCLSANPRLRDANPESFLTNLIWNTRGETQGFQYRPGDTAAILPRIAADANATVLVASGAWALPLFRSGRRFDEMRREAARLQKREAEILYALRAPQARARVRIWTMAECVERPEEILREVRAVLAPRATGAGLALPVLADLTGFSAFLTTLKNQGMHPYILGDAAVFSNLPAPVAPVARRAGGRA